MFYSIREMVFNINTCSSRRLSGVHIRNEDSGNEVQQHADGHTPRLSRVVGRCVEWGVGACPAPEMGPKDTPNGNATQAELSPASCRTGSLRKGGKEALHFCPENPKSSPVQLNSQFPAQTELRLNAMSVSHFRKLCVCMPCSFLR